MSSEDQSSEEGSKTARTVGQLVKYSREVNQSDTIAEVGTYALEATFHVMEGHPTPTIVEVRDDDLRVVESMDPRVEPGGQPTAVEKYAYDTGKTVIVANEGVTIGHDSENTVVVTPEELGMEGMDSGLIIAVPSVYGDEEGDTGVIVSVRWSSLDSVASHHVRPLEYLADHVATAINNIRARERLERARNDLATRKELIEMYDSLLRHDLGNDLQVIAGYSAALVAAAEDGEAAEYADKIDRTARSAADLIDRVGTLVKTIEDEREPEPTDLRPVLSEVIEDAETKHESLTVEFDPETADYQVYAGELVDSVFTNLLTNAAVHNHGPVTVRVYIATPDTETVVIGFADDGTGVPEEVRDDIFELGKKGPDSDGSGLGLGFVRALAESYGGDIAVGDSDLGGADFRVTLERV